MIMFKQNDDITKLLSGQKNEMKTIIEDKIQENWKSAEKITMMPS